MTEGRQRCQAAVQVNGKEPEDGRPSLDLKSRTGVETCQPDVCDVF